MCHCDAAAETSRRYPLAAENLSSGAFSSLLATLRHLGRLGTKTKICAKPNIDPEPLPQTHSGRRPISPMLACHGPGASKTGNSRSFPYDFAESKFATPWTPGTCNRSRSAIYGFSNPPDHKGVKSPVSERYGSLAPLPANP